jgi:hypothetical protein
VKGRSKRGGEVYLSRRLLEGTSQFDAVQEGNSSIITAAGAIKTIIKDPLFSVLEEDSSKTHATG